MKKNLHPDVNTIYILMKKIHIQKIVTNDSNSQYTTTVGQNNFTQT